jgi:hypothetical protein
VLVVETTNEWGTARGIPSGAGKRVVERYRLTDDGETSTSISRSKIPNT